MNPKKALNQVLAHIPQIEEPALSETQSKIWNFLKNQTKPTHAKAVSDATGLDYDTTRARISEMKRMGLICQPDRVQVTYTVQGYSVS